MRSAPALVYVVGAAVWSGWAAAQDAAFFPMGGLTGSTLSEGQGVSGDGRVAVGFSQNSARDMESVRWTRDGGLVGFGVPNGVGFSNATGASFDGAFVTGYNQARSGSPYTAYRWTEGGGFLDLGDLPGGNRNSLGMAISDDGRVIVGFGNYASSVPEGFVWTEGEGMIGVGDLEGGQFFSQASGVSGDGRVVVGGSSDAVDWGAFRWTEAEGIRPLGHLSDRTYSHAYDASWDGSVIVGTSGGAAGGEAFRWTADGGMVSLGELAGGQDRAAGFGVSDDGRVVVGMSHTGVGITGYEAFYWEEGREMRRLVDVLEDDHGLDLGGWILERAMGISADGRVIAGYGTNPAGQIEGWVALVPSPATLALLLPPGLCRRRGGA